MPKRPKHMCAWLLIAGVMVVVMGCDGRNDSAGPHLVEPQCVVATSEIRLTLAMADRPLSEILAAVATETGVEIVLAADSLAHGNDIMSIEFADTPFWQAVAELAGRAGLGLEAQDRLKLTVALPPIKQYELVGKGLLVLMPLPPADGDGENDLAALTFYRDSDEIKFVRLLDLAADNGIARVMSQENPTKWRDAWRVSLPGHFWQSGLTLRGKIVGDCRTSFRKFNIVSVAGRSMAVGDTVLRVDSVKRDGKEAKICISMEWDDQLTDADKEVINALAIKASSGNRLSASEEAAWMAIAKRNRSVVVVRIEPFEQNEIRSPPPFGFSGESEGTGAAVIRLTVPTSALQEGRIEMTLADMMALVTSSFTLARPSEGWYEVSE